MGVIRAVTFLVAFVYLKSDGGPYACLHAYDHHRDMLVSLFWKEIHLYMYMYTQVKNNQSVIYKNIIFQYLDLR